MPNLPASVAEELGKARTAGGGNWIQHGDYTLMIEKWYFQKIQDECIIVEFLVVESRKKVVYEGDKKIEVEPNAVGSEVSEVANFDGPGKLSAKANARAVALGLFGFKEGDVSDKIVADTMLQVVRDNTPAAGMLIKVSTYAKEKRTAKGEFITGRSWDCVAKPGSGVNSDELVKARLAAMAKGPEEAVRTALQHLSSARSAVAASLTGEAPAPSTEAAPAIPSVPSIPAAPSKPWLVGWTVHPGDPNFYYRGSEVKTEADIRAGFQG